MDNKLDHKACAESYEKKLADSYESFDRIKNVLHDTQKQLSEANAEIEAIAADTQSLANDLHRTEVKLSEANACNAMLVDALNSFAFEMRGEHGGDHYESECPYCVCLLNAEKAITANSESVAAWEAEKLEPLRREVSMLRDAVDETICGLENGAVITKKLYKASNSTQATAEAVAAWEAEKIIEERLYLARCFRVHDTGILASAEQIARMLEGMANKLRAANKGKE